MRDDDHRVAPRDGGSKERDEAQEGRRDIDGVACDVTGGTDDADDADRLVDSDDGAVQLGLLDNPAILRNRNDSSYS
jgi:hypothetical protein